MQPGKTHNYNYFKAIISSQKPTRLWVSRHKITHTHTCAHTQIFIQILSFVFFTVCVKGSVRLSGGTSSSEGTVEVCYNNSWGLIADFGWGKEDAIVVCNQLNNSKGTVYVL